jgi:hypothetical protein
MTADHWMNSAAIVARLNFSLALTNGTLGGKLAGIPFDAPRLLSAELLARQADGPTSAMKRISNDSTAASSSPDGEDEALALMDQMVAGGAVSAKTNAVILKQISEQEAGATAPMDSTKTLNTMAALILGSPEFQLK